MSSKNALENMDTIFIKNLPLNLIIGCYKYEKNQTQTIILNLELGVNLQPAGKQDNILQTVDYTKVILEINKHINSTQYELLEALGENLCQMLFENFLSVNTICLTLSKPQAVVETKSVGIKLFRSRLV